MFKKLTGLPVPKAGTHQNVPFSLSALTYHQVNNESMWTSERMGVVSALRREMFIIHINHDRTFELYQREGTIMSENDRLFTSQGEYDGLHIIDMDHHTEKVFGYDSNKHQFFYVKMHMAPDDTRIVVHDRSYYLSKFMQ